MQFYTRKIIMFAVCKIINDQEYAGKRRCMPPVYCNTPACSPKNLGDKLIIKSGSELGFQRLLLYYKLKNISCYPYKQILIANHR